jgi:hypothetical protein
MVVAVLTTGMLHEILPVEFRMTPESFYIYPIFLLAFLGVLTVGDPGRIDRERPWLRVTTMLLMAFITVTTALTALRLVHDIFTHAAFTSAADLLAIGAAVWLTNVIAFSLWFWDLDAGGAASRASAAPRRRPAFVFPEMIHPDLVPSGWYAKYADYLALSFNVAFAFSPTDVSAIRRWAKLMMVLEALISLTLATLVVVRAVNLL